MKKRWYRIVGLREELLEEWSEEIRKDIEIFITNDIEVLALIKLTRIEAIKMRLQILRNNITGDYDFRLRRRL